MTFKNKMKKFGNQMISQYAKNPYKQVYDIRKTKLPLWIKISLPTSIVATSLVVALVTINALAPRQIVLKAYALNNPDKVYNMQHQSLDKDYIDSINKYAADCYTVFRNVYSGNDVENDNVAFHGEPSNFLISPITNINLLYTLHDGCSGKLQEQFKKICYIDDSLFDHQIEAKKMINNISNNYQSEENKSFYSNITNVLIVDEEFKDDIKQSYIDTLTNNYYTDIFINPISTKNNENDKMHFISQVYKYLGEKNHKNYLTVAEQNGYDYDGDNINNEEIDNVDEITNNNSKVYTFAEGYHHDAITLIGANCIESSWGLTFSINNERLPFNNLDNSISEIEFINAEMKSNIYIGEGYKIVSIPLLNEYSFNILMQDENSDYNTIFNNGFSHLQNKEFLEKYHAKIYLKIPKFEYQQTDGLYLLGFFDLHDDNFSREETKWVFDNLTSNREYTPGEIVGSNSYIKVDENGVFGFACTETLNIVPGIEEILPVVNFNVNRPFMYSITNIDNIPIIIGQINTL